MAFRTAYATFDVVFLCIFAVCGYASIMNIILRCLITHKLKYFASTSMKLDQFLGRQYS